MPHIHTEHAQFDNTVTAYIMLMEPQKPPRILLHKHRKLGVYLPVGGHVELNETPWQAMAHEIEEESGYTLAELQILQPAVRLGLMDEVAVHPQPMLLNSHAFDSRSDHFHSDISYPFIAHAKPAKQPSDGESNDIRWLTYDELEALPSTDIYNNSKRTALFGLGVILDLWEPLPATNFPLTVPGRD